MTERKRTLYPNKAKADFPQGDLKALAQMQFLSSVISSRAQLASRMGKSFGGKRDIYEALGFPLSITYAEYRAKYARHEVATRVIDAPVDGVWSQKPEIVEDVEDETQFEKDVQAVIKQKKLFHFLRRVDILSCIGRYAVLLLGVDDGKELDQPLETAKRLLFVQPYSEDSAEVVEWDKDQQSERFGLPVRYRLRITEPGNVATSFSKDVHHSRIIHIAQGLLESNIYGTPRLERIYNRLLSLEFIVSGSAEMFWQGAFPGLNFSALPDTVLDDTSTTGATDIKEQIDAYVHGMKRYLTTQGIDIQKLNADVVDPKSHVDVQIAMVSIATGIPKRILEGSERGELASSQDGDNWNARLDSRRKDETEPSILRPVIDRLIAVGIVTPPAGNEYTVIWPDLAAPSNKEKADVGNTRAEAVEKYLNSGMDIIIPPKQFFEEILEMSVEQVERLLAAGEDALAALREEERQGAIDANADDDLLTNSNPCHNPGGPGGGQWF